MKRISIFGLIIFVLLVMGGYIYLELQVPTITYVSDYTDRTEDGSEFVVKRLYSSDVDPDKLAENVGTLLQTEFLEEDYYASALRAGTPRFYPAFYYSIDKFYNTDGTYIYKLRVRTTQELVPGQPDTVFTTSNLKLEVVCTGLRITDTKIDSIDANGEIKNPAPIISEDGSSMAVVMDDYANYEIELTGASGSIMLQHTFGIDSVAILRRTYYSDQLLIVNATIADNGEGFTSAFTKEDYTTVEDMA